MGSRTVIPIMQSYNIICYKTILGMRGQNLGIFYYEITLPHSQIRRWSKCNPHNPQNTVRLRDARVNLHNPTISSYNTKLNCFQFSVPNSHINLMKFIRTRLMWRCGNPTMTLVMFITTCFTTQSPIPDNRSSSLYDNPNSNTILARFIIPPDCRQVSLLTYKLRACEYLGVAVS